MSLQDLCARCDETISKQPHGWIDRQGHIYCQVSLRHYPDAQLRHVPFYLTERCEQCGQSHPANFTGDCRDDRYRF